MTFARLFVVLLVFGFGLSAGAAEKPYFAGRMLVAAEKLQDPYFKRSVVFMLEHDRDGAFGVIVNRRMGAGPLADLVGDLGFDLPDDFRTELYFGGPVEVRKLFVLHTNEYQGPGTMNSPAGIAVTGHKSIFKDIIDGSGPRRHRLVMGYAGWGAGQLEAEMARGDWLDAPLDEDLVFSPGGDPDEVWRRARDKAGLTL